MLTDLNLLLLECKFKNQVINFQNKMAEMKTSLIAEGKGKERKRERARDQA